MDSYSHSMYYTCIYAHTHTHTYIHIHTHTHICISSDERDINTRKQGVVHTQTEHCTHTDRALYTHSRLTPALSILTFTRFSHSQELVLYTIISVRERVCALTNNHEKSCSHSYEVMLLLTLIVFLLTLIGALPLYTHTNSSVYTHTNNSSYPHKTASKK